MSEAASAGVKAGDVLAGKYRIDRVLGVGGMGVVVAAHHIDLDERVAIKFLLPASLSNPEAVARFAREARAAVKIKSEHVARVSDVGKLENGSPYMVMEYLEGSDLSTWLKDRGSLPIEQAVDFLLQASEAIAEAHALGIVHRDLKPANLFVIRTPDGAFSVKVLDFGISKVSGSGATGGSMTHTSAVMGSPLYMSPEQMQSAKSADPRSDIWALGVILYELLTGEMPFTGESMPELVVKVLTAPLPPLRNRRPDAPARLGTVIEKCLEKDRGKRYATIGELAVDLLEFGSKRSKVSVERISGVMKAAGLSQSALNIPPSSAPGPRAPGASTAASWGTTAPGLSQRSMTAALMGGAALGIAVLAALVLFLVRSRSAGDAQAEAAAASGASASAAAVTSSAAERAASPASAAPTGQPAPAASAEPAASSSGAAAATAAAPAPAAVTPAPKPTTTAAVMPRATSTTSFSKPRTAATSTRSTTTAAMPKVTTAPAPTRTAAPGNQWGGRL